MERARRTYFLFFQSIENSMKNARDLETQLSCLSSAAFETKCIYIHNSNPPGILNLPYRRRIVRQRSCDYCRTKVCCPDVRFCPDPPTDGAIS